MTLGIAIVTAVPESNMRIRAAIGDLLSLFLLPCFAGDLEDGVKFQEHKDHAKAAIAFRRAALRGNAEAQRRLGFMYYHGEVWHKATSAP